MPTLGTPVERVVFRGEDEVAVGEAVDLVGPDLDAGVTPADGDLGVVSFLFDDSTGLVRESESTDEVVETVVPTEVMALDRDPSVELGEERRLLLLRERRDSAPARHTTLGRETHVFFRHVLSSPAKGYFFFVFGWPSFSARRAPRVPIDDSVLLVCEKAA